MHSHLKILMLEDSRSDAEIIQRFLKKELPQSEFFLAMDEKSYQKGIDEFKPEVILSDHALPQFNSSKALAIAKQKIPAVPFILVTGTASEEFAASIIMQGADDYILKDRIARLPAAINISLKQRKTEQEKGEIFKKLQVSEQKYRTTFYKNPLPSWIYDPETLRFLDVNESAVKQYGYTKEEFLELTIKDIRPTEEIQRLENDLKKTGPHQNTRTGIWKHLKKNGELIIVEVTGHSITYNRTKARLVVAKDITEKLKNEEKLQQSEERLKEAQAVSHLGNWEIDFKTNTYFWSDETYKILGFQKSKVAPSMELFLSRIHPNDKLAAHTFINEAFENCTDSKIIFRFVRKKNETRYASAEWHFELDKDKKPLRLFGIIQDVTEIKKAEEKLTTLEKKITEQKLEEQKKIARAIIRGQEKERNYIGQELHDNINQLLATIKMYLGSGMKKNSDFKELISYPMEVLEMSMEEIRLLCYRLVTPSKDINLKKLITDLADRFELTSSVKIILSINILSNTISDDLKLNIYRIIQEQVNNIYKYAEAKKVSINIKMIKNKIIIVTEDDGKGFDTKLKRKGVGITNMLNRVETFNGRMEITSEPGQGCKIAITIPI